MAPLKSDKKEEKKGKRQLKTLDLKAWKIKIIRMLAGEVSALARELMGLYRCHYQTLAHTTDRLALNI